MNKNVKKVTAFCLAAAAVASSAIVMTGGFCSFPQAIVASAATKKTINGVEYELGANAWVVGCSKTATSVTIPSTVKDGSNEYKVTLIQNGAFGNHEKLTSVNLSQAYYLEKIGNRAFEGCKNLQGTITIPAKCTTIADDAFNGCTSLTAFSVSDRNSQFCAKDGVLYSKINSNDYMVFKYPSGKTATSYTIPQNVSELGTNSFDNVKYMKELNFIECKICNGSNWHWYNTSHAFSGENSITSLSIPNAVYQDSAKFAEFFNTFHELVWTSKIEQINGQSCFYYDRGGTPCLRSNIVDALNSLTIITGTDKKNFYDVTNTSFLNRYCNEYADYVINKVLKIQYCRSDKVKAQRIHDWIANRVDYDTKDTYDCNNHSYTSIFLHRKNFKYTSICEGYAKGYALLLKHAGIDAAFVDCSSSAHAWTIAKINGTYYHIDVTWDDQNGEPIKYDYFMKTSSEFASDGHGEYVNGKYNWVITEIDETTNKLTEFIRDPNKDGY